ncbi:MAG: DUF4382 domain-containing protein [Nitrososphaerales archaeon]
MQLAYERKHLIISAIAGILIAGLIIASTMLSPYIYQVINPPPEEITSVLEVPPPVNTPLPTDPSKIGTLALVLTDAPPKTLKYLYIEIDEVRLLMKGNKTVDFSVSPKIYNVTDLKTHPVTLGIGNVPEGDYTAIWLHIVKANATFAENPDVNVTLKLTAQGWLKIFVRFEVKPEKTTLVVLDFDMAQTHVSQGMVLTPVVRPKQVL